MWQNLFSVPKWGFVSLLTIGDIKNRAEQLPAMSSAASVLLGVIDDPDVTRDEVAYLVSIDPVLAANSFRVANSAFYGSKREFENIKQIVDFLGLHAVQQIAVFVAAKSIFPVKEIWFQSVYIANAAKKLAHKLDRTDAEIDLAYTAALFENYGEILLSNFYREEYLESQSFQDFYSRLKREKEIFGYNHIEISAIALASMGIPQRVLNIIESSNSPLGDSYQDLNVIIEVARLLFDFRENDISHVDEALTKEPIASNLERFNLKIELDSRFLISLLKEADGLNEMNLV